jgi:hypothetical protein
MVKQTTYGRKLLFLLSGSLVLRVILALLLELGNDEVYYWTYALYPDLSHFDHPPMVGWMIQLFTLNLALDHELFIRMPAIIFGTINTFLIYLIGRAIRDAKTGWYAALLYTASIYAFIIAGTFILPDTPQLFYWLISLYFIFEAFNKSRPEKSRKMQLIMAGLAIGLAMLSKYTSVFLWIGAGFYMLVHERRWFRTTHLYLAILVSIIIFLPVIIWNFQNGFISFTFHSGRVGLFDAGINPDTFFTELVGQVFYNNPVNFLIIIMALTAVFRGKVKLPSGVGYPLLYIALPLILLFLFLSFFRRTLPHWTGPAYTSLILVGAYYLAEMGEKRRWLRALPGISTGLVAVVAVAGLLQVNAGLFWSSGEEEAKKLGKDDVTLDMYGWGQIGDHFKILKERSEQRGLIEKESPIISYRWFPAAHLDYYAAKPAGTYVLTIGNLDQVHKYAWITAYRGGLKEGMDAWFITTSRDYADVNDLYGSYFEEIEPVDTLQVMRSGRVVENAFFYRMKNLQNAPSTPFWFF